MPCDSLRQADSGRVGPGAVHLQHLQAENRTRNHYWKVWSIQFRRNFATHSFIASFQSHSRTTPQLQEMAELYICAVAVWPSMN